MYFNNVVIFISSCTAYMIKLINIFLMIRMDTYNQNMRSHDKNKRKWNHKEDVKLIQTHIDMVKLGAFKVEN